MKNKTIESLHEEAEQKGWRVISDIDRDGETLLAESNSGILITVEFEEQAYSGPPTRIWIGFSDTQEIELDPNEIDEFPTPKQAVDLLPKEDI